MKKIFLGVINPATTVSLSGLVCAFFSVLTASWGREKIALSLFILLPLFDFFDGIVARKTNKSQREFDFGSRLDPMLDLLNFAFAPSLMFYFLGFSSIIQIILLILFLLCGAFRQGDPDGGAVNDYFTGLPIPYGIILLALGWVLSRIFLNVHIFTVFLILTSILLVLRFPFKKQKGIYLIIWPFIAFISVCFIWFVLK
jgi:CDP-diacylglycerol--serine O-phosphatidyltransferase